MRLYKILVLLLLSCSTYAQWGPAQNSYQRIKGVWPFERLKLPSDTSATKEANTLIGLNGKLYLANGSYFADVTGSGGGGGVNSFNGRIGTVSLISNDVNTALGFIPISPSDTTGMLAAYVRLARFNDSIATLRSAINGIGAAPVSSVFGRTGAITAQVADYGSFYPTISRFNDSVAALRALATTGVVDSFFYQTRARGNKITDSTMSLIAATYQVAQSNYSTTYALSNDVRDSLTARYTKGQTDALLAAKLNISDTSVMLSNYVRSGSLGGYVPTSRTINGLDLSANRTLTTDNIGQGSTNLYFSNSLARSALSAGTGISYNSTTGAISSTITQYTDVLARAALSAGTGISYNNTTGQISSTITQYTDALARASLSFAAGSGGYNSSTGVITIPTNTSQLTNGAGFITGINSTMVTTALGYTPYNASNPNGFITSSALSPYALLSGATFTGQVSVVAPSSATAISLLGRSTDNYSALRFQSNTGATTYSTIYTDASNLIFENGGSERLRITSSGNVGIGTTSPDIYSLGGSLRFTTLSNSTASGYSIFTIAGGSGGGGEIDFGNQTIRHAAIASLDGSALGFYTNSTNSGTGITERLRITRSGNVGIGTTSPVSVDGYIGTTTNATTGSFHVLSVGGVNKATFETGGSMTQLKTLVGEPLIIGTNNITRLTIAADGAATFSSSVTASSFSTSGSINQTGSTQQIIQGSVVSMERNSSTGALTLSTNASHIILSPAGNVGIGTTSPSSTLSVNGTLGVTGAATFSSSVTAGGRVSAGVTSGQAFYANHTSAYSILFSQINSANTIAFDNVAGELQIYTGGSKRFTIASTGAATFSSSVTANGSINATTPFGGTFQATDGTHSVMFGSYYNTIGTGNSYDAVIYASNASAKVSFFLNGAQRAALTSSGDWSANRLESSTTLDFQGTTTPAIIRHQQSNGTNAAYGFFQNTGGVYYWGADGNTGQSFGATAYAFVFYQTQDRVFEFFTNETRRLSIGSGGATFTTSVTATSFFESSDIRLKEVFEEYKSADGINPILYTFKNEFRPKYGYSAQQVEKELSFAVQKGDDGYLKVDYTTVHTYKIMQLEKRIAELEKQLKK